MPKKKQVCSKQTLTDQLFLKSLPFQRKPLKSPSIPKTKANYFHFGPAREECTIFKSPIVDGSGSEITSEESWSVTAECSVSSREENRMSEEISRPSDYEWESDDSVEQMRTSAFSDSDFCVDQLVAATSKVYGTFVDSDDFDPFGDPVAFSTPFGPPEKHAENISSINAEGSETCFKRNLPKASSTLIRNFEAAKPNERDFNSLADPTISSILYGLSNASVKDLHSIGVEELPIIPEVSFVAAFDEDDDTLKNLEYRLGSVASSHDIQHPDSLDVSPQKVSLSRTATDSQSDSHNFFLEDENENSQSCSSGSTFNAHQTGTLDALQNSKTDAAASKRGSTYLLDSASSESINNKNNKSFQRLEKTFTVSTSRRKRREKETRLQRGRKHSNTVSKFPIRSRRNAASGSSLYKPKAPILRSDVPVDDIMFVVYGPGYMDSVMSQISEKESINY